MTTTSTASTALAPRSNTLAVYDRIQDPLAFAEQMCKDAASMMGAPLDQGRAIALHALCEGLTIVEMQRRYHWIAGSPTMRADAMLAEFRMNYGGDFEVVESSPERCCITLIDQKGREKKFVGKWKGDSADDDAYENSRWPWKDWHDHTKGLKDNWATPTDRANMMFANTVRRSLKQVCPELVAGVYTPEEAMDVQYTVTSNGPAKPRQTIEQLAAQAVRENWGKEQEAQTGDSKAEEVMPAEFEVKGEEENLPDRMPSDPGTIAERQIVAISELFHELGLSGDKRREVLAKRSANSVRNLSHEQAEEIIDKLRAAARQREQAAGN